MNTDFRLLIGFSSNPKIRRLKRRHGPESILSLIQLWEFTAKHRPEGILYGMDDDDILDASGWNGDAEFVKSLEEFKLIDLLGDCYEIHDWETNNPWAAGAIQRSEKAREAANVRWEKTKGKSDA